ncbi:MAG: hypothetical protein WBV90_13620 [Terrimicrobiaceae bacterium]
MNALLARRIVSRRLEDRRVLMAAVSLEVTERRRRVDGKPVAGQLGAHRRFILPAAVGLNRRLFRQQTRDVSVATATSAFASHSRISLGKASFCRSFTTPSLNGTSLAWRVGDGDVNDASIIVEALRARGDFACFINRISGGLARGRFS